MATQLQTIAPTFVKMRWKEQYASEGLNRKFAGIITPGIYRGFTIGADGADLSVVIDPDPTTNDHSAVYESSDGFSVTVRDDASGSIVLDLTSMAPGSGTVTVVVVVFVVVGTCGRSAVGLIAPERAE